MRTVQRKLKELGYYTGSVDGDFGAETEKAVKAFQKANGLSADGKVGEQTLKKLNDKNAKTAKQANATATRSQGDRDAESHDGDAEPAEGLLPAAANRRQAGGNAAAPAD